MMVFHSTFVVTTLAGKPVSWSSQERGDRGIGFGEALWRHKWHVLLGLAWGAVILWFAPRYIWWLLPVLAGLVLSVPLTMLTSRAGAGQWLRRHRLLLTPEEAQPPKELAALTEKLADTPMSELCEPESDARADDIVATPPQEAPVPAAQAAATAVELTETEVTATASAVTESNSAPVTETGSAPFEETIVPPRSPLRMEAATPVYLRPRDALNWMFGATSGAAS
jgi:membrane glycosyltransferase